MKRRVSVPMLPPSACWPPAQCQLSVNLYQPVSSSINSIKLPVSLQSDKKSPFLLGVTLQEKWLFALAQVKDRELTTSLLRQNSSWACLIATFSLHYISPHA